MYDILKTRRSIRKFTEKNLEEAVLEEILKGALMAPSSRSIRPWELVVVRDKDTLSSLSRCRGAQSALIGGADTAVVVTADTTLSDVWVEDTSILAAILQLEAHAKGLGSCWVQIRNRSKEEGVTAEDYIKELLKIPEGYGVECIIALGYPAEARAPHEEEKLPMTKIRREQF
ncbi:nitroreductase family protein [Anaerocolumna sp. AGMB13020]|uniref:nitroreductase family protein n=1 Tax=Anaerocolumna sp. AGMB13020 TaxID=3081750 RepID=UPI002954D977|nr:nitroreductase family protein [Anaerocolumna sp. AGMB13020]WOO34658.1 nitroreductase family protein [Anaerocolumna sp. AGMB13020]